MVITRGALHHPVIRWVAVGPREGGLLALVLEEVDPRLAVQRERPVVGFVARAVRVVARLDVGRIN